MSNNPSCPLTQPYLSLNNGKPRRTEHDQNDACQQSHHLDLEVPPSPKYHSSSSQFPHEPQSISPVISTWNQDNTTNFSSPYVQDQLPFTPECAFELEVFQQWRSGHPAYQQPLANEIFNASGNDWGGLNEKDKCINMTDSGVDFSEPTQYQDMNNSCASPSLIQEGCKNPDQCELSPDMAEAMIRFSVPHICEFEQAKRLLVDKIVNRVLQNAAPRIMTLLEQELEKREAEMEMEDDEEDMDSVF